MRSTTRRVARFVVSGCLFVALSAGATPVPVLDVAAMVKEADVVVVGVVTTQSEAGTVIVATVEVDQLLKGRIDENPLRLQYLQPDQTNGYGAPRSTDQVFFLKRVADHFEFVSPYYPSVVGLRGIRVTASNATRRVAAVVGAVLQSPSTTQEAKHQVIYALTRTKDGVAVAELRTFFLKGEDDALRLEAAAALLHHDDLTALPFAERVLLMDGVDDSSTPVRNIAVSLRDVRDTAGIPSLSRLLGSPSLEARRAVADALRQMRSRKAIPALTRALNDEDLDVAYAGVIGLAELTKTNQYAPSVPAFRENPRYYLDYWREWARGR